MLTIGARQDRHDKAKWHTAQGVVSVTGMKFMNFSDGVGGGGAIDLAMHLNRQRFKTAVEWLSLRFPCLPEPAPPRPVPSELKLPTKDASRLQRVRRYLTCDRRLAPSQVEPLIESGRIYADTRGNAVFVLLGKENTPVGAELRGTTRRPWRGMAVGSRKDLGYFSALAPQTATVVVLCESAIDAISCSEIHPARLCISTAGARPNPDWLAPLIRSGYDVFCGFDSDPSGDHLAAAMIALYPSVKRLRPERKDWNDILR